MSNKCSNYFFSDLFVRNMHLVEVRGGRAARSEIFWGWGAARGSFLTLIDNKVPAFFSRIVARFSADRGRSGGSRVAVQHK